MLRVADVVGEEVAKLFPYETFNKVQSKCADKILNTDDSLVVSAPTGSGKTDLMVMAMLRMFGVDSNAKVTRPTAKVVYIAPIKALASEKAVQWEALLKGMGIKVCAVTGDTVGDYDMHIQTITESNVIVTTPEKFDSVTRRWRDEIVGNCVHKIGLLLIDEVHLLGEERGAVLEALVSRMKVVRNTSRKNVMSASLRFIAVSATMSNSADIGAWINASDDCIAVFSNEDRPVPLSIDVRGFYCKTNPFLFERFLTYKLPSIISELGEDKPVLVFCQTRKSASLTAAHLAKENANKPPPSPAVLAVSKQLSKQLLECVQSGVAYHHAGMSPQERSTVEQLYFSREIQVLCTTTTLAMGVNLPAHLVIIKGTTQYHGGKNEQLTKGLVMQMAGRAGRAGMDTKGKAVVMTSHECVNLYNDLSTANVIESRLHENIIEHINAEVCLRTIGDRNVIIEWLKTTFYWIRAHKNPPHYGLQPHDVQSQMITLCEENLERLVRAKCIRPIGSKLQDTVIGRSMARYYLSLSSVEAINNIMRQQMNVETVLQMLAKCGDLDDIRIRMGEKKILNSLLPSIRYPLKAPDTSKPIKAISDNWHKRYILIQTLFAREIQLDDWTLKNDQVRIQSILPRLILHCLEHATEYSFGPFVVIGYNLLRGLEKKLWGDLGGHLKQFEGIGDITCQTLERIGVRTLDNLLTVEAPRIDATLNRSAPFGNNLKTRCAELPRYCISVTRPEEDHPLRYIMKVHLSMSVHSKSPSLFQCQLIACTDTGILVCNRRIPQDRREYDTEICAPKDTACVKVLVVNSHWFGIDAEYEVRIQQAHITRSVQKQIVPVTPPQQVNTRQLNEHPSTPPSEAIPEPKTIPAAERKAPNEMFKQFEYRPHEKMTPPHNAAQPRTQPSNHIKKSVNTTATNDADTHLKVLKELVTVTGHDVYSNNTQLLGAGDNLPVPLPTVSKDLTAKPKELPMLTSSRRTFKNLFNSAPDQPAGSQTADNFFPSSAAARPSGIPLVPSGSGLGSERGGMVQTQQPVSGMSSQQFSGRGKEGGLGVVDQFFPSQPQQVSNFQRPSHPQSLLGKVDSNNTPLSQSDPLKRTSTYYELSQSLSVRPSQQKSEPPRVGTQTALDEYFPTVTRTTTPLKVVPTPAPKRQSALDDYFPKKYQLQQQSATPSAAPLQSSSNSNMMESSKLTNTMTSPERVKPSTEVNNLRLPLNSVGGASVGGTSALFQNLPKGNLLHPQLDKTTTRPPWPSPTNDNRQLFSTTQTAKVADGGSQSELFLTRGCAASSQSGRPPQSQPSGNTNTLMGAVRGSQQSNLFSQSGPQPPPPTTRTTTFDNNNLMMGGGGGNKFESGGCLDFDIEIEPTQQSVTSGHETAANTATATATATKTTGGKRLLSSLNVQTGAPQKKASSGPSILEQLKELVSMKKEGMLTDSEFTQAKSLILQEREKEADTASVGTNSSKECAKASSDQNFTNTSQNRPFIKPVQSVAGTPRDFNPPARPVSYWNSRQGTEDHRIRDAFQKTVTQIKSNKCAPPSQQPAQPSHVQEFLSQF
eukprot:TRINITY_DN11596_c1_g1_i1.p1 TRINITY_DN11596_c1_g1~~TRINITY_DN11596_c1_g1_i1.p1  ORF type:complete len:1559 (+),score=327.75 TRINITY_DN11596_c1_g1_i1:29-4678(+)